MPLLILLVLPLILIALMPLILVQRYRLGTARRQARLWLTRVNLVAMAFSALVLLVMAGVTSVWVPRAFSYTLGGLGIGMVLGSVGVWLTRWEATPRTLHYIPNRWLVLAITLIVSARVVHGLWRSWAAAQSGLSGTPLVMAFGIPESLAAGATVPGYYFAYAAGLRRRIRQWESRALRGI